jgi:hypothetical protein
MTDKALQEIKIGQIPPDEYVSSIEPFNLRLATDELAGLMMKMAAGAWALP